MLTLLNVSTVFGNYFPLSPSTVGLPFLNLSIYKSKKTLKEFYVSEKKTEKEKQRDLIVRERVRESKREGE